MFQSRVLLVALAALPAVASAQVQKPAAKPAVKPSPAASPSAPADPATPSRPRRLEDIDTNHDGFVSLEEFMAVEKERFAEFDMNHDGKIDAPEIAKSPPLMERNLHMAEGFIKKWDANGDGIVSTEEFQKYVSERFAKEDKEGTGRIPAHRPPPVQNPKPGAITPILAPKPGSKPPATPKP